MKPTTSICGIVLAAGLSSRMGRPKMLLPWKGSTVIDQLLQNLENSVLKNIIVVTGANRDDIEKSVSRFHFQTVFNPQFENGSMLVSLQTGLRVLPSTCSAFFVILGDQPSLKSETINSMANQYFLQPGKILIPSYKMQRGHPWLLDFSFKNEILGLKEPETLRDFLRTHETEIAYQVMDNPEILDDMDTLEDYEKLKKE